MLTTTPLGKLISHYCDSRLAPLDSCRYRMELSFETAPILSRHMIASTISNKFGLPFHRISTNDDKKGFIPRMSRLSRYAEYHSLISRQTALFSVEDVRQTQQRADDIYCRCVGAMRGFKLLLRLWRIKTKKYQTYEVDTDFMMNPLSDAKPEHIITLLENSTLYRFKIHDLLTIIKSSLLHSAHGFPGATRIKNPYTNLIFSDANVYNIYFFAQLRTHLVIHPIIRQFFECEMNLTKFKQHNEEALKVNAQVAMFDAMEEEAKYDLLKHIYIKYPAAVKNRWLPERLSNEDRAWILSKCDRVLRIYMLMSATESEDLYQHYESLLQRVLYGLVRRNPMMISLHFQHIRMKRTKRSIMRLTDSI